MKKSILLGFVALIILASCNRDKKITDGMNQFNNEMTAKGYHMGDVIKLPASVTDNASEITISFGYAETKNLKISPQYFTLGENDITFNIKTKSGKILNEDATINVFADKPAQNLTYQVVATYPHDPNSFVQGFQLIGNMIYESDGQYGQSRLMEYPLGQTKPTKQVAQPQDVFSEGCVVVGDKIYQLTWKKKMGFIYDKNSFQQIGQFNYPPDMAEGWGITYDGTHLITSDGSSNLYFLALDNPSKLQRTIGVASENTSYDQLNELEYHDGFIYANVWQKPIILKIDPKTGAVVGRFDLSKIAQENTTSEDNVLNGITFKGDNMLITGKDWSKIYELKVN